MPSTSITGYISPDLASEVAEYQEETGKGDSKIVTEALEEYLERKRHP